MHIIKIVLIVWMLIGGLGANDTNLSPLGDPPGWNGTETVSEMSQDNEV